MFPVVPGGLQCATQRQECQTRMFRLNGCREPTPLTHHTCICSKPARERSLKMAAQARVRTPPRILTFILSRLVSILSCCTVRRAWLMLLELCAFKDMSVKSTLREEEKETFLNNAVQQKTKNRSDERSFVWDHQSGKTPRTPCSGRMLFSQVEQISFLPGRCVSSKRFQNLFSILPVQMCKHAL